MAAFHHLCWIFKIVIFVPCQEGPEEGWFLKWKKATCQCVERVICSGTLIVTWKYPAIVDNWLRNILQLSTIFLFSQTIMPLDMVNALSCAATFPFTVLMSVNSTSSWCSFLLQLSMPLEWDSGARQLALRSPPGSSSLGVMFGWAGMPVLIRLMFVLCILNVILH